MEQPDIEYITRSLETVLQRERREAIVYTLLTVLCTPAFVGIASLVIASVALYVWHRSPLTIDCAMATYTGMTIFLGAAIASVTANAQRSQTGFELDRTWLASFVVFLILVVVTYATSLQESHPIAFGVVYVTLSFLVLGLAGQTQVNHPPPEVRTEAPTIYGFVLAIAGFVVAAYGELLSASWLWVPPRPDEIRMAARVLCRLAAEPDRPLDVDVIEGRVVRSLLRLRLIEMKQQRLRLVPKGLDFLRTGIRVHKDGELR